MMLTTALIHESQLFNVYEECILQHYSEEENICSECHCIQFYNDD